MKYDVLVPRNAYRDAVLLYKNYEADEALSLFQGLTEHYADFFARALDNTDVHLDALKEIGRKNILNIIGKKKFLSSSSLYAYVHGALRLRLGQYVIKMHKIQRNEYAIFPKIAVFLKSGDVENALTLVEPVLKAKAAVLAKLTTDPAFYVHDVENDARLKIYQSFLKMKADFNFKALPPFIHYRLSKIMINFVWNLQVSEKSLTQNFPLMPLPTPEQDFAAQEDRKTLHHHLPLLLAKNREKGERNYKMLFLHACEGITLDDAAHYFGLTGQRASQVAGTEILEKRKKKIASLPLNNPPDYVL